MSNLFTALTSALFGRFAPQNDTPRRFRCSSNGATLQFYKAPFVHQSYDAEGNELFTGQSIDGKATYGFVTCRLACPLSDRMLAEQRLFLFMEHLHPHYGIECTTGLDTGLEHRACRDAVGMSEYWQDADGKDWKVMGWTDGTLVTVLYIRNISITDFRRQDAFFESFRFAPARKLA
ncbi:hypothetical protein [Flaviaesturariibacter aridisoli]|uniref:Uncharacterized protein n=1 Tax=Flaviaesturariibacter aridisoli TaxID=2545761 RepID=A0A4V6P657_9BACT|nr:hypothetical protein [Flaviaesturariibacter aridisoli]TCZ68076.1 hypothetical protein E0486_14710 [Flaviaesturariibacter aridisoli]